MICIPFRAITRYRMGIRSASPSFLHGVSRLVTRFCDTLTARGTILSEIIWAGWVSCNDGSYLQFESCCSDVKTWEGGRVLRKKEDGNNFEGEARIDLELSSARMGSRPTTLCTRYLTRFLASYTYSRLRIRIVQNNY